jgi:hypothetical protein
MSVPTHSEECQSKAFKTLCFDCGQEVYFFMCSCGSKVLFDSLGHPWPIHSCEESQVRIAVSLLEHSSLLTHDEIYAKILLHSNKSGMPVSERAMELIDRYLSERKKPFQIKKIGHSAEVHFVIGRIHQINNNINMYTRMGLPKNMANAAGLLGDLGYDTYSEIIVRSVPDFKNISSEYSLLIKSTALKSFSNDKKAEYAFSIESTESFLPQWLVKELKKVDHKFTIS